MTGMELYITYYANKELTKAVVFAKEPKLEIRAKLVVISDGEITKFACKYADFVSMQF